MPVPGTAIFACLPLLVIGLSLAPGAPAAEEGLTGEIRLGWREVSRNGDQAKYRQHLDLDDGPRLFDLELSWRGAGDEPRSALVPDRVELHLSDLGGDPYESARLAVHRVGRYRLTYDRQESDYFYDDVLVLPENADPERSDAGDFRRFDFRRTRDRAALLVDVSDRTAVHLAFDGYRKRGDSTTVMEVEREEFELERPVDETLESVALGVSHTWDGFTLTFTERYRAFDFDSATFLPGLSEGSDPEAPTRLDFFFLAQPYDLESWEHELKIVARPGDRLRLDAAAVWGDVDVDLEAGERSQGVDFAGMPFAREQTGRGRIDQDRALYDLGARYAVTGRLGLFTRLRHSRLEQSAASAFDEHAATDWDIETSSVEAGAELAASATVSLAGGWSYERRQVNLAASAGGRMNGADATSDADGYFLRASWRPSPPIDVELSAEDLAIDDPFTLASPTDSTRYRVRARYRWRSGITATAAWRSTERRNDNSGWHADVEQLEIRLAYTGDRLALSAGASRVEQSRSVDSLVLAGPREVLFAIDYGARADFVDLAASWRLGASLDAGISVRRYDNDRSFPVERDDVRVSLSGTLAELYRWGLSYRRIDFEEGGIEAFDADLIEVSLGRQW